VVGLKPTYGRVSRYGLVAFASSLDQIGPMAKSVEDAAMLASAIDGHDARDSTSVPRAVGDYLAALKGGVKGMKIGLPKEYFVPGMDAGVEKAVRDAVAELEKQGAVISEISLPHSKYCLAVYYLLATSEASSNLARYDGVRYGFRAQAQGGLVPMYQKTRGQGFGAEVKRRIMLGTYALSSGYYDAYYLKAQKVRTLIKGDFDKAFESVDIIATPTAPTPAFKAGEKTGDPLTMYLSDILTISANLAGIPAMSQPCGFSGGLPVGLQLMARPFDEETLFRAGRAFEQATDWHQKKPEIN
jgi:aspartyl-tRNA(Asn)/glutamyl-tRNA(Gln) amidotransferase subunit A